MDFSKSIVQEILRVRTIEFDVVIRFTDLFESSYHGGEFPESLTNETALDFSNLLVCGTVLRINTREIKTFIPS